MSSHFKRVVKYARPSDYAKGAAVAAFGPSMMLLWERVAPSHVGRGGFAPVMRLSGVIGAGGGFLYFYACSISTLYLVSPYLRRANILSSAILWRG